MFVYSSRTNKSLQLHAGFGDSPWRKQFEAGVKLVSPAFEVDEEQHEYLSDETFVAGEASELRAQYRHLSPTGTRLPDTEPDSGIREVGGPDPPDPAKQVADIEVP